MGEEPSTPFTLSRAVHEWCFVQAPMIPLDSFRGELKARGLNLARADQPAWETLDREGLIEPVGYALTSHWTHDLKGALQHDVFRIREETGYRPWSEMQKEVPARWREPSGLVVLYHRWQILAVGELESQLTPAVPWGNLADGLDGFKDARAKLARPKTAPPAQLDVLANACRQRELLLVRVQEMLWPFQQGGAGQVRYTGSQVTGLTDDAAAWSDEQWRTADFGQLAAECGTDRDSLATAYLNLAWHAQQLDPNAELVDLLSQLRRDRRERLHGQARLAVDWYDAARMLRTWHHLLTPDQDPLPDIDELRGINGTEYKRARFGTLHVDGNRSTLPTLLEDYGLYPWRVQLIGEGESELTALRTVLDEGYGLSFEHLGIVATDLGGADIPDNAELLLTEMHLYVNYFLLVFDNEGRAREVLDTLQRTGAIEGVSDERRAAFLKELAVGAKQIKDASARREALRAARERSAELGSRPGEAPEFVAWEQNFEASNFTHAELCEVANSFVPTPAGAATPVTLSELEATLEKRPATGVASVLLDLTEQEHTIRIAKPDYARALARFALQHPEHNGEQRPLLDLAEHLIRLAGSDRRLAGRLRD